MNDLKPNWSEKEHLFPGIWVYRDVIKKELNIIDRIEDYIDKYNLQWQEAMVGYKQKMPEYRDCVDFKFKKSDIQADTSTNGMNLQKLWQDVYDKQSVAVKDYCKRFNIMELRYWEAFNFIKYEPGHHFMEHHDHGYSYNCVVSLVAYINDDYEGGEIEFPEQNIKIKPEEGSVLIFPTYHPFIHKSYEVKNGYKYFVLAEFGVEK